MIYQVLWGAFMVLPIIFSALLFYLSYPNFISIKGFPFLAWIAVVPFFYVLDRASFAGRLKASLIFGILSNLAVVNWMIPYSLPGYCLLIISLSSQAFIFAALYFRSRKEKAWNMIYIPAAWVVAELMRKYLMLGESWDWGHSQVFDSSLMQVGRIFGSPGISFLLILVNFVIFRLVSSGKTNLQRSRGLVMVLILAVGVYGYGLIALKKEAGDGPDVFHVCVLQPNTDFRGDITDEKISRIMDENIALSRLALEHGRPDLVVWPETAIPVDFLQRPELKKRFMAMVKEAGVPFLVGMVFTDPVGMHNSVALFDKDGCPRQVYHKQHLIPLTEFVPPTLLWKMIASVFHVESPDFLAGRDTALMPIVSRRTGARAFFGVAVCSEDNIAGLFREYADKNAGFVIVPLNNGWFLQKEGLVMHAQHSMMHSAEFSMPVIRAANTGLSGLIDRYGRLDPRGLDSIKEKRFFYFTVKAVLPQSRVNNLSDTFCFLCGAFVILFRLIAFERKT